MPAAGLRVVLRMERNVGNQLMQGRPGRWVIRVLRRTPFLFAFLIVVFGLLTMPEGLRGQDGRDSGPSSGFYNPNGLDHQHRHILIRQVNIARQKEMVSDAEKLVQLAGELDAEVRAAGDSPLSAEQLSKIDRIQKLAHSVKDKMQFAALPY